jgi:hypothetical protein
MTYPAHGGEPGGAGLDKLDQPCDELDQPCDELDQP